MHDTVIISSCQTASSSARTLPPQLFGEKFLPETDSPCVWETCLRDKRSDFYNDFPVLKKGNDFS